MPLSKATSSKNKDEDDTEVQDIVSSCPGTSSTANTNVVAIPQRTLMQTNVRQYMPKKMGLSLQKSIDNTLMLLFTKDFQPFSVVEDIGFKKFVNALNPSYHLPSRKTISKSLLSAAYEETYNKTKTIIETIKSVTLTTDCWHLATPKTLWL